MQTRYFLMEIQEIPAEIIDIRTSRPLPVSVSPALPAAAPERPAKQLMPTGRYLSLWLDVTASLAIVALCAAFWVELMM